MASSQFACLLLLASAVGAADPPADPRPEPRSSLPTGGRARTELFGISADGFKFVYVFDRSASMAGKPLSQAKAELKASLQRLGDTHQFQIIFYNERPKTFALAGQPGRLVFGNESNRTQANRYIDGVTADGSTDHELALYAGLNMLPDVIYFLTDGDKPALSAERLSKIVDRNRAGTIIHVIQFGAGPAPGA